MICRPPLLTRLRRHRGLWVLALAVLLIKLVTSSACLADAPPTSYATHAAAITAMPVVDAMHIDNGDSACVLGEAGGCHCSCAHNLALPTATPWPLATLDFVFASPLVSSGYAPAMTGSLLRPPIV